MKKKIRLLAAAVAGMAFCGGSAQAASITSQISTWLSASGGQPVGITYQDDDRTTVILDSDLNGILSTGDVIQGVFIMTELQKQTPAPSDIKSIGAGSATGLNELTGWYQLVVTADNNATVDADADGRAANAFEYSFGATAAFELLYGSGAVIAVFEDSGNDADFLNPLTLINDGDLYAVLGLSGAGIVTFEAQSNKVPIIGFGLTHTGKFTDIATLSAGTTFASSTFSLNTIGGNSAIIDDYTLIPDTTFGTEIVGSLSLRGPVDGYSFSSKAAIDVTIAAVPSPNAACASLALMGMAAGARRLRRKG